MEAADLKMVSVDDQLVAPPDMFEQAMPEKWLGRARRVVRQADGADVY